MSAKFGKDTPAAKLCYALIQEGGISVAEATNIIGTLADLWNVLELLERKLNGLAGDSGVTLYQGTQPDVRHKDLPMTCYGYFGYDRQLGCLKFKGYNLMGQAPTEVVIVKPTDRLLWEVHSIDWYVE